MTARSRATRILLATIVLGAAGCASAPKPVAPPAAPPSAEEPVASDTAMPPAEAAEPPAVSPTAERSPAGGPESEKEPEPANPLSAVTPRPARKGTADVCSSQTGDEAGAFVATRRTVFRTLCGAAVWFDGLFGDEEGVEAGRSVRGRVELSLQQSEYWGFSSRGRLRVRADLPQFERRLHAFIGRENEDEFISDRSEGLALRSQFFDFEQDDRWVAGLGYGLPGKYSTRNDVRLGAKIDLDPDLFVQLRHRRNWFLGLRSAWRFRETLFYTLQDGFGSTTSMDFDHIINRRTLGRWANVGTISQATHGLRWRSAVIFYRSLWDRQAIAQETYVRGETDTEVPLREYGLRLVYRRPILGHDWLFGELVGGYGWVRQHRDERREGSALVGFGIELLFGRGDPY